MWVILVVRADLRLLVSSYFLNPGSAESSLVTFHILIVLFSVFISLPTGF